jgi:hypothetical protein
MGGIRYETDAAMLELSFSVRGGTGSVHVHYGVTEDPVAVGFDLVAVGFDATAFRGFPVCWADVRFDQGGYRAMFGWIQLVTTSDVAAPGDPFVSIDIPPFLAQEDSPLAFFGYQPTLFDAPANPGHPDGEWIAESFLVAAPDVARTRRLAPITGFRWGYRLTAGVPEPLAVAPIGPDRWDAHRALLAERHPSWAFLDWSTG